MAPPEPIPPKGGQGHLFPLDIIRTETVLSRNPIHNLSKRGGIEIAIQITDKGGRGSLLWKVLYNHHYGPPGPLAYKVDTLVVNRRIEEAGHPVPKLIRLGSLSEICGELGLADGKSTQDVKRALLQNAFAGITARLAYTATDGTEHTFEFNDTRYGVILTGQKFTDGRKANAVHLVLHDTYRALLDRAPYRPLNYDYLKTLSPGAQRFYELISYQIFAALKHSRPQARYLYSDYCTFAPQTRYFDWEHTRKQMYKLHATHLQSGYLAKVEYEETTDGEGRPDWCFWYSPGRQAEEEFNAFAARRQPRTRVTTEIHRPRKTAATPAAPRMASLPLGEPEDTAPAAALVEQLVANELNRSDAERLAREKPDECRRQLTYLPFVPEFKSTRGAYLRAAIEGGFGPPKSFTAQARQEKARQQQGAEVARQEARQSHQRSYLAAYLAWMKERVGELESSAPDLLADFQETEATERARLTRLFPARSSLLETTLQDFDRPQARLERLRKFLAKHQPALQLPDFWAWDAHHNPASFRLDRPPQTV